MILMSVLIPALVLPVGSMLHADDGQSSGSSFEDVQTGPVKELKTRIGTWMAVAGRTIVDDKHAKTGRHCLQLTGGDKTVVTLQIGDGVETSGALSFHAERWTARKPFSFRIEKNSGRGWTEIYNGDARVRVGRAFRNHVKVPLLDDGIEQLRFTCTSPPNTGILIDDIRIAPARPQKIVNVEVAPFTLPALVGAQASSLVRLKIETTGILDPVSVTELRAKITGAGHIESLDLAVGESGTSVSLAMPADSTSAANWKFAPVKLDEEENTFWIKCRVKMDANIDQQVGAAIQQVTFSNGQTVKLDSPASLQRMGVAVRNGGDDGVHTYRIPGLATTNEGTLIGVYDVRRRNGGDLPGDIDVGMSRSTDGGRKWEPMQVIMDMGDDSKWHYDGIGDPAVLVDRGTGTIWVAATWSHGNRSWRGSGPGLKPEETGQFMLVRSDDDGVTWSKPINITNQVKKPEWCFILQGPGKGITMRDGTIVFAAQYQDPPEKRRLPHSTIIYSKDHGKTWHAGTGAFDDTTEAQIVESEPGVLMLNCRYNRKSVRVVMTTRNMGQTWQKHPTSERALIEPGACMASLIDVDREVGKDIGGWLLFSNPDSLRGRNHITIKASPDRGQTWPIEHRLLLDDDNSGGYSCMSMIDEKTVGVLYEGSQAHMTFQRIPLSDVLGNSDAKTSARDQNRPLDVFVLTGQSNSLGTVNPRDARDPNPPASSSDTRVPFFWSNRSTRAGDSTEALIGDSRGRFVPLRPQQGEGSNPVFWGPEFGFARTLSKAGHANFAIIKASRGGGGNSFWLKGSRDDHMYHHVVATVADAIKALPKGRDFRIRAVLYVQGESDNAEEAARAGERIETLLKNLRADLPQASEVRLLVGGIAAAGGHRNRVREQQKDAAGRNESIEYVDNSDLASHLYDRTHFDRPAKLTVGERLARKWLAIKPSKRTARATGGPVLCIAVMLGLAAVIPFLMPDDPAVESAPGEGSPTSDTSATVVEEKAWVEVQTQTLSQIVAAGSKNSADRYMQAILSLPKSETS